jgi:hypothetical protein
VTHDAGSGTPMSERMQSLLARAVDDQRSEQRSLADALDEVRTQLAALSQQVAASREQPTDQQEASAVTALTVELRESTRRTAERLDNVARMVAQRGEDLVTLQNTVSALREQLRAQGESVTGLAGSVDGVGQHVSGIATYLGDRAHDDSARIIALEQRLVTLQNDMTAVGSHVSGLTDAAATTPTGDELDARIRSIVAGALVGTERRLATHVEDSVLALAEAMLRHRPPASQPEAVQPPVEQVQPAAPAAEFPPVTAPAVDVLPTPAEPAASQPLTDPLPPTPEPPTGEAPSPDQTVDLTDGHIATGSAAKVPAAWTTVMPAEDDQRRRGWFRSRE